jgi:3-deoxy-D-manno-octulosonate 8-phosphate phosphatase (KDO 8-P phosphatase)
MISILFLDCDGILTTGTYIYDDSGKRYKEFSSVDSNGIFEAENNGIRVEVISSDPTGDDINEARCRDIGIPYHRAIDINKQTIATQRLNSLNCDWDEVAAMGDDITDIDLLTQAQMAITVPNAVDRVQKLVEERNGYITDRQGGEGAVAEAIRHLISS